jgi:uncharacterized protein YkwD
MVRPPLIGIALSSLIIVGSTTGCDSFSMPTKVILPTETPTTAPAPKTSKPSAYSKLEMSIHEQVNQYRQARNLPPLKLDATISEEARVHSEDMAKGLVPFGHQGFEQRVKAIAKSIPYRGAAENVAFNQGYSKPGEQAVEGWINSPGHEKNMVGQYDLTGIGVAKNGKGEYYFTQIFIRRGTVYGF